MLTITKKLDMSPHGVPQVIRVSQYDSDFTLEFKLFASGGNFAISTGTTAEIRGTKQSGTGYSASATLDTSTKVVTVAGAAQMTAVAGMNIFEIVLKKNNKEISSANFCLLVERAALDADTITDESVLKELNAIIESADTATQAAEEAEDAADRAEAAAQTLVIDSTLTQSGQAADAKAVGDEITELKSEIKDIGGLSEDAKNALLNCFENVAWINGDGRVYYNALYNALYPESDLIRIDAVFNQGSEIIYPYTPLNSLKAYMSVTGYYNDGSSRRITDYSVLGELAVGTSIITVSSMGRTDTVEVIVSAPYWDYVWEASSGKLPEGMIATYYDFTTENNALYAENPVMDFDYIGNQRVVIECKMYTINKTLQQLSYRNNPQITLTSISEQKGCKLIGSFGNATTNPDGNLTIGINGVNTTLSGAEGMIMHEYDLTEENGTCTLSIDGTAVALTQNQGTSQYLRASGISAATLDDPLYGVMVIKSIKYKKL